MSARKISLPLLLILMSFLTLPFSSTAHAAAEIELSRSSLAPGEEVELRARIALKVDEYVYASTSPGGWPTSLKLSEISGLKTLGDFAAPNPKSKDIEGSGQVEIHNGEVVFVQRFRATGSPGPRRLKGEITYQICDASSCKLLTKNFDLAFEIAGVAPTTNTTPNTSSPAATEIAAPPPVTIAKPDYTVRLEAAAGAVRIGEKLELRITMKLAEGFYVYSPNTPIEGQRTSITLKKGTRFKTQPMQESKPKQKDTEYFKEVLYHEGSVVLKQSVKAEGAPGATVLEGQLDFQACDANTCMNETLKFAFPVVLLPTASPASPALSRPAPPAAKTQEKQPSGQVSIPAGSLALGQELELLVAIDVPKDFYLYATDTPVEGQQTSLTIEEGSDFRAGILQEPKAKDKIDEFGDAIRYHTGNVRMRLPLKATGSPGEKRLKGRLEFQVCGQGKCVPGWVDFDFPVLVTAAPAAKTGFDPAVGRRLEDLEGEVSLLRNEVKKSRGAIVHDVKQALRDMEANLNSKGKKKYDEILSYHHDDWEGAIAAAKKSGKQLFVDFTGYFCQNCRMMETTVLIDPKITKLLKGYERVVLHTDNPNDTEEKDRHRELLKRLGGPGPIPAYFIVDPATEETIGMQNGATNSAKFKLFLEQGSPKTELGWIGFLLTCIGLGLLTIIMPCTYPMIPITISVFSKGDKATRRQSFGRAGIYALGIIVSYTAIGGVVQLIFGSAGQQKIQDFANNGIVNLLIGGAFLYFAFSFFGFYEIAMPSFLRNLMQKGQPVQDESGAVPSWSLFLMGVFFMLTSYSCGAPFVLAVFEQASQQAHPLSVVLALFIFSATLSLPFLLLALLPGALKSMPKSGGWFTTFKVTLGFFELAFALKFLSTTDITYNFAFLTRPVFVGVWIVILALAALYLLGFIRFPHDMKTESVGMGRLIVALILLVLAIYLGSWFAGEKLNSNIEALMPPHPYPVLTGQDG